MSTLLSHKSIRITKPTHGSNLKGGVTGVAEVLIDRNQQWKHIAKSLIAYYETLVAVEQTLGKEAESIGGKLSLPFHEGHAFLGEEGGWQHTLYSLKDRTHQTARPHAELATFTSAHVLVPLQAVRTQLKAHIATLYKEAVERQTELEKERELSAKHLTQLGAGIDTFEHSAQQMLPQHDPYITHIQVAQQLAVQVEKENELQTILIRFQSMQAAFEADMSTQMQTACAAYDKAKAACDKEVAALEAQIAADLQSVKADAEYNYFATKDVSKIEPNTPLRSVDAIVFPGQNHAATIPIKMGPLERKKRYTKSYKESFYVLTPSGFLQERKTSDDTDSSSVVPIFSLFLPECSLGQPSKESDRSHKFHLEGNKAHKTKFSLGSREHAYSFRARTHAEMIVWWTAIDQLCRDTKAAPYVAKSSQSPISFAVANVGRPEPVASPTSPASSVATRPTAAEIEAQQAADAEDEEGGSSAEEEELARTAPSTPAVGGVLTSPLEEGGLPVYAGEGVTTAEKQALVEKGKPVLGEEKSAEASTSKGWFA